MSLLRSGATVSIRMWRGMVFVRAGFRSSFPSLSGEVANSRTSAPRQVLGVPDHWLMALPCSTCVHKLMFPEDVVAWVDSATLFLSAR